MMIKLKDLSWPLKIGVVGGFISLLIYAVSFLVGFLEGLLY